MQISRLVPASLLIVALGAPGCVQTESHASLADAAEGFVAAWNDRDADAMRDSFEPVAGRLWSSTRLDAWMRRALRRGEVTSFDVGLEGEVRQPNPEAFETDGEPLVVEVPYAITYDSDASADPVEMNGDFRMAYEPGDDRWLVPWTRSLMWPGVEDAVAFDVRYRWLRRGAILDRRGEVLARGHIEDRRYPFGATAGTTVGHVAPLTKEEATERGDVAAGELAGASGLEAGLEERLAGRPSSVLSVVDAAGETLKRVGSAAGKPGRRVKTTLDMRVQHATEAAYGATTGGAVVIDPRNGDVLAIVSSSPFDPNNYVGVPGVEPFNRAVAGLYPPGSAMKVVTASAALDTKVVNERTTLSGPAEYRGVRNFESGEFGTLSFATAVQHSVNTAFAQVALKLGPRRLTRYAEAFGFNRPHEMSLATAESSFPFPEDEGDLMWGSIGQAQVVATPLEMATVAATVANGGKRMEPRVTAEEPKQGERVMRRSTARTMTTLMENVVKGGTGTAANISGARVAGKTGTAEVDVGGKRKNHAWFVCFAPADDPRVAVAVVSEYGGVGGQVAAPLAGRILLNVLPLVR